MSNEEAPAKPVEVTTEHVMVMAIRCQQKGHLAEAKRLYDIVLQLEPGKPEALHYSGVLAFQMGQHEEAIARIEKSLELAPREADWHNNLGNILQKRGRLDEAAACYRRTLALNPVHADALNNLGVLLKAEGKLEEAEEAFRTAIRENPKLPGPHYNLAILLTETKRLEEAIINFRNTLNLKGESSNARHRLVVAYYRLGQLAKAIDVCEEWVAQEPDNPLAQHTLASVSGRDVPVRASDAYVEKVFDEFAASFEAQLAELNYRAPSLIAAAIAETGIASDRSLDILDAGCGTGLCGPLVAAYARRLVGVDLSDGMLEHAKSKGVYDELIRAELTAYLESHPAEFDLILTADTLVYFGALEAVFAAAAAALRPGGHFVFTVEETLEDGAPPAYTIKPHGRYTHRAEYIESGLVRLGFAVRIKRAQLRTEGGLPVEGLVVSARKTGG